MQKNIQNIAEIEAVIARYCEETLLLAFNASTTLGNQACAAWEELNDGSLTIADFRRVFIGYAERLGYSRRWVQETLTMAGFRTRTERADSGKARKSEPSRLDKALAAFEALTSGEKKAFLKRLASV